MGILSTTYASVARGHSTDIVCNIFVSETLASMSAVCRQFVYVWDARRDQGVASDSSNRILLFSHDDWFT